MTQEQSKMIDLEKICAECITDYPDFTTGFKNELANALCEAIRQALELAAENAECEIVFDNEKGVQTSHSVSQVVLNGNHSLKVNKQSIISVNELVK